jgi:hypothetical protein
MLIHCCRNVVTAPLRNNRERRLQHLLLRDITAYVASSSGVCVCKVHYLATAVSLTPQFLF